MAKSPGIHSFAIALSVLLFSAFVVSTALYANYGRALVLRVFEENQLHRATVSRGMRTVLHLADYIRVDPSSIGMRGRLVDALIENNRASQALDVARDGLQETPADELQLAQLVLARAAIAAEDTDRAGDVLAELTQQPTAPAEAWYYLALLRAAQGDFPRMREAFDRLAGAGTTGSTQEFVERSYAAQRLVGPNGTSPNEDPAARARALLILGRLDDVLALISKSESTPDDPRIQFWHGVHEELQGRVGAARTYYKSGSARHDSLASIALSRPPG